MTATLRPHKTKNITILNHDHLIPTRLRYDKDDYYVTQKQKDNQQEKHWQQIIKFWFVPVLHFFKKHRQPIEKFSWIPVPVRETVRKKKDLNIRNNQIQ